MKNGLRHKTHSGKAVGICFAKQYCIFLNERKWRIVQDTGSAREIYPGKRAYGRDVQADIFHWKSISPVDR
jgi:hypothetical protein